MSRKILWVTRLEWIEWVWYMYVHMQQYHFHYIGFNLRNIHQQNKRLSWNFNSIIFHTETGVNAEYFFKPAKRKCNQVRKRTWDLLLTRETLCMTTCQAHSSIMRFDLSYHSVSSRLEKLEREISQRVENSTEIIENFNGIIL